MRTVDHNRKAWNKQAREGSRWSIPVDAGTIEKAKNGEWELILTPNRPVPGWWLGEIAGKRVLCLASGGGQQAPVLAAAGARVVSFDNSDEQLDRDREVAERDRLEIETVRGDMANLEMFEDGSFDLIYHPVSNVYVEDIEPVWEECHRVLVNEGRLLSGFMNPVFYMFDYDELKGPGNPVVRYSLPYSDVRDLDPKKLQELTRNNEPYEFGHTLEQQIGGQLKAGFTLVDLYEDDWTDEATPLNRYMKTSIATLAVKHRMR